MTSQQEKAAVRKSSEANAEMRQADICARAMHTYELQILIISSMAPRHRFCSETGGRESQGSVMMSLIRAVKPRAWCWR